MGQQLFGTADVILTGGTWSGGSTFACASLTIAGNVAISSGTVIGTTILTYSSGTVTHTGTLGCSGSPTFNTAGMTWSNISINGAGTYTINSLLSISSTLTIGGAVLTFAGTAGFTCAALTGLLNGVNTITLVAGVTYTITSAFTFNTSRIGSIQTFASSSPTVKAILTLNPGATCNVLSNFTRIDSSAGRIIRSFNGTITDCLNIVVFNNLPVSGF
jgi:hypothetical protein